MKREYVCLMAAALGLALAAGTTLAQGWMQLTAPKDDLVARSFSLLRPQGRIVLGPPS